MNVSNGWACLKCIREDMDQLRSENEKLKAELQLALSDASIKHKYRADVLERENEKLKTERDAYERALLIESNEPQDRSQEAAHYNWLDDQNEKLKAERDFYKSHCERFNSHAAESRREVYEFEKKERGYNE